MILIIEIPSLLSGDSRQEISIYFSLFGQAWAVRGGEGIILMLLLVSGSLSQSHSLTSHLSLYDTAEAPTDGSRLTDGGCRLGAATVLGHSQC